MSNADEYEDSGARLSTTTRLEAFSDGVFAIAATALVLEITAPQIGRTGPSLAAALGRQWPSFFGFILSFVTIGIMWASHHNMFDYIKKSNHTFRRLNTLLLMFVAFLPYPTSMMAEYILHPAATTAAILYASTFLAIALMYNALWWYALRSRQLIAENADAAGMRTLSRRYAIAPVVYAVGVGIAYFNAIACLVWLGTIIVFSSLPERQAGRRHRV